MLNSSTLDAAAGRLFRPRTRGLRRRIGSLAPVLAGGLALALIGCGSEPPPEPAAETVLTLGAADVAAVRRLPLTGGVRVTGSLDPAERVEVKAQLSGQLDRVTVERGSRVSRGETLAVFDTRTGRAQQAGAAAQVAAARRDFEAAEMLYKAGAVSERDLVNAKTALESAQAQLAQNRESVDRGTVRAPIAGVVSERQVSSGEAVQPGQALFTLVNSQRLELAGKIGAENIAKVRLGQSVLLSLDAYPDRRIEGKVERIEPVADPETRQVTIYIVVPNPAGELVGGLFATGVIVTAQDGSGEREVATVPTAALQQRDGETSVLAVADGRLERRPVTLGVRDEGRGLVEVEIGLAVGELVVVSPSPELTHGTRVQLAAVAQTSEGVSR